MKKLLLILIPILLLVVAYIYFVETTSLTYPYTKQKVDIPSNILSITDEYIINKVGKVEFDANYQYDSSQDYKTKKGDFQIFYNYKPASQISGEKQYLVAHVHNNKVSYINGLYSCDTSPCKLDIDKEEAIDIARNNGFFNSNDAIDFSISLNHTFTKFKYWTWMLYKPLPQSDSECWESLVIEIHANTGETSDIRIEKWCA